MRMTVWLFVDIAARWASKAGFFPGVPSGALFSVLFFLLFVCSMQDFFELRKGWR